MGVVVVVVVVIVVKYFTISWTQQAGESVYAGYN